MRLIDLTGQQFGSLTVVQRAPYNDKNNKPIWECRCECGNICYRSGYNLRKNQTSSCGCKESENRKKAKEKIRENLLNKTFGKLTVIDKAESINGKAYWKCKCECGNITNVRAQHLKENRIESCGCCTVSHGENKIAQLLKDNNISFQHNYHVKINNKHMYFDFFVDNKYFIEYDGSQHFISRNSGWNTEENLIQTQKRDKYKNQYCSDNNIPIIRIPYTLFNNLTLEDLLLETSNFILKEKTLDN